MKKIISVFLAVLMSLSAASVSAKAEFLSRGGWTAEASSAAGGCEVDKILDGDDSTYWHSSFTVADGQVTAKDNLPFILTVTLPEEKTVSGIALTPRQNSATGRILGAEVYAADSKEPDTLYLLQKDIAFNYDETLKEIAFDKNITLKKVVLKITAGGADFGALAEFNLIKAAGSAKVTPKAYSEEKFKKAVTGDFSKKDGDGDKKDNKKAEFLPRDGWTAEVTSQRGNNIGNILDGDSSTYWHSNYTNEGSTITGHDNPPYDVTVTLPKKTAVSGVAFLPRGGTGDILKGEVYGSDSASGDDFYLLADNLEFTADKTYKYIEFDKNVSLFRVRLRATETVGGYGTMAEFNLLPPESEKETVTTKDYSLYNQKNGLSPIDTSTFTAIYDGENIQPLTNLFDGSVPRVWQTEEIPESKFPVYLTIDLKREQGVRKIVVTPRQTADFHGLWLNVTAEKSSDGKTWEELGSYSFEQNLKDRIFDFEKDVRARYFRFKIEKAIGRRVSAAEIYFYRSKAEEEIDKAESAEKYILKVGSDVLISEKGKEKNEIKLDTAPFISSSTTLIPLRGLLEEMGATVDWNGETREVTLDNSVYKIKMQIWNRLVYVDDPKYGTVRYTLLQQPMIKDERTFIPVRFVSEILGYNVSWDAETKEITITK